VSTGVAGCYGRIGDRIFLERKGELV